MGGNVITKAKTGIARVRVDLRINREFDYSIPAALSGQVRPGSRVKVPFGSRQVLGTVLKLLENEPSGEGHDLKAVLEVVGGETVLTPSLMKLAEWLAGYYLCPMDRVLRSLSPAVVRKKGSMRKHKVKRDAELVAADAEVMPSQPLAMTQPQADALAKILASFEQKDPKPIILFGVTGSGKTEVYLQAMQQLLDQGKGAIMLVPEIALTPQTLERLRARFSPGKFGEDSIMAVLHSGLSDGERFREWQRIRSGQARLVVGARSAVFAPVQDLGLIVVDEEHEHTYKQEEHPRYHARDVAVMRGHFEKCGVVLGSATPSLETYHNHVRGKFDLCVLPDRVDSRKMPAVQVVDMRKEVMRQKGLSIFSEPLKEGIQRRLERGEQVILYLNRRGYASNMICPKCGYVAKCENCAVSLTYHRNAGKLKCHYCNAERQAPRICPNSECKDPAIRFSGLGTEKLEEMVSKLFPQARVARMDSDTMTHREDYEKTLLHFKMGRTDILLGTQMIAKGLDFPRVTLVGIVQADTGLHLPDFRSGEKTFQQILQAAGRAGRGEVEGEVVVQTFTPDHEAIRHAVRQDFPGFYENEMKFRQGLLYPPVDHLIKLEFSSTQSTKAEFVAKRILEDLKKRVGNSLKALGPAPAPMVKLRGKFRFHLILGHGRSQLLKQELQKILQELPSNADVLVTADVDPMMML